MERTIISFDYAIKYILRDKANFDILSGFLTELLNRPVNVQDILESEGETERKDGKVNRLDLKAKIDDGEMAVFEIQFFDQIDFLGKVLFNACKAVVEQVSSGKLYDIKKVYSVNIAYFDIGADKEYVFVANLSEFKGTHFIILPNKFNEEIKNKFDEWVYVLKKSSVKSDFTAAGIQAAGEKLDILKMTPEERAEYERIKQEYMTQKSQLYTAELKGKKDALEQVVVDGKQNGFSIEQIKLFSKLSEQQIIEILKKHSLV